MKKVETKVSKLDKVKWLLSSSVAVNTVLLFAAIANTKAPRAAGDEIRARKGGWT